MLVKVLEKVLGKRYLETILVKVSVEILCKNVLGNILVKVLEKVLGKTHLEIIHVKNYTRKGYLEIYL